MAKELERIERLEAQLDDTRRMLACVVAKAVGFHGARILTLEELNRWRPELQVIPHEGGFRLTFEKSET